MKIVVSPAKSLDFETDLPTNRASQPLFPKELQRIHKVLAGKRPRTLARLMDISSELAELNWQRNQDFSFPFTADNARPAVFAFAGDVYQGLDAYTFPETLYDRLQDSLRILSGLYGILRPFDLMQAYRLEMGTNLPIGRKKNLYEFWRKTLTAHLNSELHKDELFVNLASNEYAGALLMKELKVPVITPVFKDWKNDDLKVISFFAKKARGAMARFLIENDARKPEDLLSFDGMEYTYSKAHTLRPEEPVFVR